MMEAVLVKHLFFPVHLEKAIRIEELEAVKSSTEEKKITKALIIYVCHHAWSFLRTEIKRLL